MTGWGISPLCFDSKSWPSKDHFKVKCLALDDEEAFAQARIMYRNSFPKVLTLSEWLAVNDNQRCVVAGNVASDESLKLLLGICEKKQVAMVCVNTRLCPETDAAAAWHFVSEKVLHSKCGQFDGSSFITCFRLKKQQDQLEVLKREVAKITSHFFKDPDMTVPSSINPSHEDQARKIIDMDSKKILYVDLKKGNPSPLISGYKALICGIGSNCKLVTDGDFVRIFGYEGTSLSLLGNRSAKVLKNVAPAGIAACLLRLSEQ